jgi:hypothetical protein
VGPQHGIVAANPFDGMTNELPKFRYQLDPKPNAFTEAEREQSLHSFRTDRRPGTTYQHDSTFVESIFLTGCRPSEAIGLHGIGRLLGRIADRACSGRLSDRHWLERNADGLVWWNCRSAIRNWLRAKLSWMRLESRPPRACGRTASFLELPDRAK